jgi:diguanylate cyclase
MSSHKTPAGPKSNRHLLERALEAISNAIFITDASGRIVWSNAAFTELSGYSADEALGRTPAFLKSGVQDSEFYTALWNTIRAGRVWQSEVVDRHRSGALFVVDETITPLFDARGQISHYIAIQHDITQKREQAETHRHLAFHDYLTGLPNRLCFEGALQLALARSVHDHARLVILYLDLDRFKQVNDTLGHQVGDLLLVAVAARMRSVLRESDMVARLGGDEFAVLLGGQAILQVAEVLAAKLIATLGQPYSLAGREVSIGASVGIAQFPEHGDSATLLLERADAAMYRAKGRGGAIFDIATGI